MIYHIYKQRKKGPPYFVEACHSWLMAKRICRIHKKILKINGHSGECQFFYKRTKG